MSEKPSDLSIKDRINLATKEVVKDGKFPRAVTAQKLVELGFATRADQDEFCRSLVENPDNKYGRVLVVYRKPDEKSSPVRWFARGREHPLGETFVAPHIEPEDSKFEVFELVSGRAKLAIYEKDSQDSKIKFIKLVPHEPQVILPGQIHTVLCDSEMVEVVEFKVISDEKINPKFAQDIGLVDEKHIEQTGPQIGEYLRAMHAKADAALS